MNFVKALCLAERQSEGLFVVCGQCSMFFVLFSESMKNFFACVYFQNSVCQAGNGEYLFPIRFC